MQHFPGLARQFYSNNTKFSRGLLNKWSNVSKTANRRRREVLIDKTTGKKYEKYEVEAEEIGNEALNDDNYFFDDQIDTEGMIPAFNDYSWRKEDNLMDAIGTRW